MICCACVDPKTRHRTRVLVFKGVFERDSRFPEVVLVRGQLTKTSLLVMSKLNHKSLVLKSDSSGIDDVEQLTYPMPASPTRAIRQYLFGTQSFAARF